MRFVLIGLLHKPVDEHLLDPQSFSAGHWLAWVHSLLSKQICEQHCATSISLYTIMKNKYPPINFTKHINISNDLKADIVNITNITHSDSFLCPYNGCVRMQDIHKKSCENYLKIHTFIVMLGTKHTHI